MQVDRKRGRGQVDPLTKCTSTRDIKKTNSFRQFRACGNNSAGRPDHGRIGCPRQNNWLASRLPLSGIPDDDETILACRYEQLAVCAEARARHRTFVFFQRGHLFSRGTVPDTRGPIRACGHDQIAIRAEARHPQLAIALSRMLDRRPRWRCVVYRPNDRLRAGCRDEMLSVLLEIDPSSRSTQVAWFAMRITRIAVDQERLSVFRHRDKQ